MNTMFLIGGIIAIILFFVVVFILYSVSRKSQKTMESVISLMTAPERARVMDAVRVLKAIMGDEIAKIESSFASISKTLSDQIITADVMEKELVARNVRLTEIANNASSNIQKISTDLENTLGGFQKIIVSDEWKNTQITTNQFQSSINELLSKIDSISEQTIQRASELSGYIENWATSGGELSNQLQSDIEKNTEQMNTMSVASGEMITKLSELSSSVATGFADVKKEVLEYQEIMTENDKLLSGQLDKLDNFTKQSKKTLTAQLNNLSSTANAVGSQIRLAESSMEKQEKDMTASVENLMSASQTTEEFIKTIASEVTGLAGKFQLEIRDFASGIVGELNNVQGVATTTLSDTKEAAGAFAESVRAMTQGVRQTLIEMNTAHEQLTGQSTELVRVSQETTEQLKPLSELIEKYYAALPDLTRGSTEMTEKLGAEIVTLDTKLREISTAVETAIKGITESSSKLNDLSGKSRQQMIELLSDYARASDTMQTLTRQMAETRATAPMAAIAKNSTASVPVKKMSDDQFMEYAKSAIQKLNEIAVDLTHASGAEISESITEKYNRGDTEIFAKMFAKTIGSADKKQIQSMIKNNAIFHSQATQFVRGWGKVLAAADQVASPELQTTLSKSDLGKIYTALRNNL
ncbi:MAG: hypothetical protein LBL75_03140 [Rickettsiales bacterium]|nr:hypothetical protein [Rickettsiales bacterium]